jgi:hypothetical protein
MEHRSAILASFTDTLNILGQFSLNPWDNIRLKTPGEMFAFRELFLKYYGGFFDSPGRGQIAFADKHRVGNFCLTWIGPASLASVGIFYGPVDV